MAELDRFEARFTVAYRRYLAEAPVDVDAIAVARRVAAAAPRRRGLTGFRPFGLSPALAWLVLLATLLLAAAGIIVGSGLLRNDRTVVPPLPPATPFRPAGVVTVGPDRDISDMAFAPDGGLWTVGPYGVVRWDTDAGTASTYGQSEGLPTSSVDRVEIGRDGTVWVGGGTWLARFGDGEWRPFTEFGSVQVTELGGITVAPDGTLWAIATTGRAGLGCLLYFDGEWHETAPMPEPEAGGWSLPNSVAVDPDGTVWTSSDLGDLYAYRDGSWTRHTRESTDLPGQPSKVVAAALDGSIWASMGGRDCTAVEGTATLPPYTCAVPAAGVARFDGTRWTAYSVADGLAQNEAAIAVGADGSIWATHDAYVGKVSRFDGARWTAYAAEGFSGPVAVAPDGSLVAMAAEGALRFDGISVREVSLADAELPVVLPAFSLEPVGESASATAIGEISWQTIRQSEQHFIRNLLATSHGIAGLDGNALRWSVDGRSWDGTLLSITPGGLARAGEDLVAYAETGAVRIVWDGNRWLEGDRLEIEGGVEGGIDHVVFGPHGAVMTTGDVRPGLEPRMLYSSDRRRFRPADEPPNKAQLAAPGRGSCSPRATGQWQGEGRLGPLIATADGFFALAAGHPEDWNRRPLCEPVLWWSLDGNRWELRTTASPLGAGAWVDGIAARDGHYVAVGGSMWTSDDGLIWNPVGPDAISVRVPLKAVAASEHGWVTLDEDGNGWTSADGMTWESIGSSLPGVVGWYEVPPDLSMWSDTIVMAGTHRPLQSQVIVVGTVHQQPIEAEGTP